MVGFFMVFDLHRGTLTIYSGNPKTMKKPTIVYDWKKLMSEVLELSSSDLKTSATKKGISSDRAEVVYV
jgi:hypothetical protein